MEEWKPMVYRGLDLGKDYLVSNEGRVWSLKTDKILKQCISKTGYYTICISIGSRKKHICIKVHKAVAENFIPNPNNYPLVNHKDLNKLNNNVDNLEWCTPQYNVQHAGANGCWKKVKEKVQKAIYCVEDGIKYDSILAAGNAYAKFSTCSECARKNINRALSHNGTAFGKHWVYC